MKTDRPKSPMKFYTIEQIAECVDASTSTCSTLDREGALSRPSDQRTGSDLRGGFPGLFSDPPGQLDSVSSRVTKSPNKSIAYR